MAFCSRFVPYSIPVHQLRRTRRPVYHHDDWSLWDMADSDSMDIDWYHTSPIQLNRPISIMYHPEARHPHSCAAKNHHKQRANSNITKWHKREKDEGVWCETVSLGYPVNPEDVSISTEDGMFTLTTRGKQHHRGANGNHGYSMIHTSHTLSLPNDVNPQSVRVFLNSEGQVKVTGRKTSNHGDKALDCCRGSKKTSKQTCPSLKCPTKKNMTAKNRNITHIPVKDLETGETYKMSTETNEANENIETHRIIRSNDDKNNETSAENEYIETVVIDDEKEVNESDTDSCKKVITHIEEQEKSDKTVNNHKGDVTVMCTAEVTPVITDDDITIDDFVTHVDDQEKSSETLKDCSAEVTPVITDDDVTIDDSVTHVDDQEKSSEALKDSTAEVTPVVTDDDITIDDSVTHVDDQEKSSEALKDCTAEVTPVVTDDDTTIDDAVTRSNEAIITHADDAEKSAESLKACTDVMIVDKPEEETQLVSTTAQEPWSIKLHLAGFEPADLQVKVKDGTVTVVAEHKEENKEEGSYCHKRVHKMVTIPTHVVAEKLQSYLQDDGHLRLTAPIRDNKQHQRQLLVQHN